MSYARTSLPLLAVLSSFAVGCATGGTDDSSSTKPQVAATPQGKGASAWGDAVAPRNKTPLSPNDVLFTEIFGAFQDVLGVYRDGTFTNTAVWSRDNTALNDMLYQHRLLAHVAGDGLALVTAQESVINRLGARTVTLDAETQDTFAKVAALSDLDAPGSLRYFLAEDRSSDLKVAAMRGYMDAVEKAGLETRLEALHAEMITRGNLTNFALAATETMPRSQGAVAMKTLELRFASLVATEIRAARALAAAYAFDGILRPESAYQGQDATRALEVTMKARLQEQAAAYMQAAAMLEIYLGHDVRMVQPDQSGSLHTPGWLSDGVGRAAAVSHFVRDAAEKSRNDSDVIHVAFLARGVDDPYVTVQGEVTHRQGEPICAEERGGDCVSWDWADGVTVHSLSDQAKATRVRLPDGFGVYGYLNRQSDGVHLSSSNHWSIIEATLPVAFGKDSSRFYDTAWLEWSTSSFSRKMELKPQASGQFVVGEDLRYQGPSMQLQSFPWQADTTGQAQFLSSDKLVSTSGVRTGVWDFNGAAKTNSASQKLSLSFKVDRTLQAQFFGQWNVDRRVVGGSDLGDSVMVDCAESLRTLPSKFAKSAIYLNQDLLAGSAQESFGSAEACRSTSQVKAPSMMDPAVTGFEGIRSNFEEIYYKEGRVGGGETMSLTVNSGVSSNSAEPYFVSDEVSLRSFVVVVK